MSSPSQPGSTLSLSTSCCSFKVATLRWNFFPELVLPELRPKTCRSNTRGTALRPEPWPFSKKPDRGAAIDSSIFETSTPISTARCCTRLTEFHDSTSLCQAMSSEVALYIARQNGGLSFHIFPVYAVPPSQFIGKAISVCNEDKTTNSAECFCHKELDFGNRVVGLQPSNRAFANDRMRSTPSKRESISMVACVEEDRVQTRPGQTRSKSRSRRCRK